MELGIFFIRISEHGALISLLYCRSCPLQILSWWYSRSSRSAWWKNSSRRFFTESAFINSRGGFWRARSIRLSQTSNASPLAIFLVLFSVGGPVFLPFYLEMIFQEFLPGTSQLRDCGSRSALFFHGLHYHFIWEWTNRLSLEWKIFAIMLGGGLALFSVVLCQEIIRVINTELKVIKRNHDYDSNRQQNTLISCIILLFSAGKPRKPLSIGRKHGERIEVPEFVTALNRFHRDWVGNRFERKYRRGNS